MFTSTISDKNTQTLFSEVSKCLEYVHKFTVPDDECEVVFKKAVEHYKDTPHAKRMALALENVKKSRYAFAAMVEKVNATDTPLRRVFVKALSFELGVMTMYTNVLMSMVEAPDAKDKVLDTLCETISRGFEETSDAISAHLEK